MAWLEYVDFLDYLFISETSTEQAEVPLDTTKSNINHISKDLRTIIIFLLTKINFIMFIKLFKSCYFKPITFLMALAMLTMSFTMPNGTVVLKAGTMIPMELVSTITSKTARNGQMVDFRVMSDVKVDGKTVIPTGSIAQGQIVRAKKSGLLGSEGELEISVKSVKAVDGTNIYLSSNNISDEGSNKVALSIVLTLCCLFGFLIKGGKAEIPAGTQVQGMVASNTEINV